MSDLLFDVPEQLSPRLAWLVKHNVSTHHNTLMLDLDEPWSAWTGSLEVAMSRDCVETGVTEDEALVGIAKRMRVPLWNETPASESLGGGGLGLGENAAPKEATDNAAISDVPRET